MIRLSALAAIAVLLLCWSAAAQTSEPTKKSPPKKTNATQDTPAPQPPIQVTIQAPQPDPKVTQEEREDRRANLESQKGIRSATEAIKWVTAFQLLAGLLASGAAFMAARAAKSSALAARDTLATNMSIERAYVKSSHNRPGLEFFDPITIGADHIPKRDIKVNIKVQNAGNTPSRVTGKLFQLVYTNAPLARTPTYNLHDYRRVEVFLTKDESFNAAVNFAIDATAVERIQTGVLTCYLVGLVDYIDKFGRRHRAGYARLYDRDIDSGNLGDPNRNNLPFVLEPGYNYDRIRARGEGDDWDDAD